MGEPHETIELVRDVGYARLASYDGCVCSHVKIRHFDIEVSCRSGSGGSMGGEIEPGFYGTIIHVSSTDSDIEVSDWSLLAEEVLRQVKQDGRDAQQMIRLCTWKQDFNGECSYCGEPREERWGYFCSKHKTPESRDVWN